jgi:transcriptional regulator with XRE-family HTH domain
MHEATETSPGLGGPLLLRSVMLRMTQQPLADDPSVQRRRLGTELRRRREALNLKQREAAAELEWSLSKLIRIEAGAHGVSVSDLKSMIDFYKISDTHQVEALMSAARASRGQAWWSRYRDAVQPPYARYLGHEGSAESFRVFHPFLVPGLLQTEEYATELLKVLPDRHAARLLVELKMDRQERLFAQPGLSFTFIMGEEALYRWIGGRQVMQRQLAHLAEVAGRANLELRIVPFDAGAYRGLYGPLVLLRLVESGEDVSYVENVGGDQIIRDDPETISRHEEYFETMIDISLSQERGDTLLRERIERLRRADDHNVGDNGAR